MNAVIRSVKSTTKTLRRRYDAKNDIIPGAPDVTWADRQLVAIVQDLTYLIEQQAEDIAELRGKIAALQEGHSQIGERHG